MLKQLQRSLAIVSLIIMSSWAATPIASAGQRRASGPVMGGNLTLGAAPQTVLDWTQVGFQPPTDETPLTQLGSLFDEPLSSGGQFVPDLATSYKFNADATELTITVRKGLTFSDGSPLTAKQVQWNWSAARDDSPLASTYQELSTVRSVGTEGTDTVDVSFSRPDAPFISAIASGPLGLIASPKAVQVEGQNAFDLMPVGAGAFAVTNNTPGEQIILTKNPRYWNAAHVYLKTITYLNSGPEQLANYDDLAGGSIDAFDVSALSTATPILGPELKTTRFNVTALSNLAGMSLALNTATAPFKNKQARVALAECFDRSIIADDTLGGFATPEWVLAGPSSFWFPANASGTASLSAAEKLDPYPFAPAAGKLLVKKLGGLSFTVDISDAEPEYGTVATAMAQQWQQNCGINVAEKLDNSVLYGIALATGKFTAGIGDGPNGDLDPRLDAAVFGRAAGPFSQSDLVVNRAIEMSFEDSSSSELASGWLGIWSRMDADAFRIPIVSAPEYLIANKCLRGVEANDGASFVHAWFACSP